MVTPANLGVPVHNVLSVVFRHALAGVLSIDVVCLQCGSVEMLSIEAMVLFLVFLFPMILR